MNDLAQTSAQLINLTTLTLIVVGLTRIFHEIAPEAPVRVVRLACYLFAVITSALIMWKPPMTMREYVLLTIHNALVIGTGAIGAIATFERTNGAPKPARKSDA